MWENDIFRWIFGSESKKSHEFEKLLSFPSSLEQEILKNLDARAKESSSVPSPLQIVLCIPQCFHVSQFFEHTEKGDGIETLVNVFANNVHDRDNFLCWKLD